MKLIFLYFHFEPASRYFKYSPSRSSKILASFSHEFPNSESQFNGYIYGHRKEVFHLLISDLNTIESIECLKAHVFIHLYTNTMDRK